MDAFVILSFCLLAIVLVLDAKMHRVSDLIGIAIYYNLLFLIGIGLYAIYFGLISNSYLDDIDYGSVMPWAVMYFNVFIVVFLAVSRLVCRGVLNVAKNGDGFDVLIGRKFKNITYLLFFGLLILFAISENAPLKSLFTGDLSNIALAVLRSDASHGGGFFDKVKTELIKNFLPLLFPIGIALYFERRILILPLIVSGIVSLVSLMWFIEKASVVYFALSIVCVVFMYRPSALRVSMQSAVFLGITFFFLAFMFYFVYAKQVNSEGFGYLLDIFEHRFSTQSVGYILSFLYFPEELRFRGLAGISNMLARFSGEDFQSVYACLIDYIEPEFASISGSMSSFSGGDAWGLFGYPGLIIAPLVCGVYYGVANSAFYSRRLRFLVFPLTITLFYKPILASSFFGFLFPVGFTQLLIGYWAFAKVVK
ncbi:MAG TPA: hypothetical protein PKO15_08880 [Fibrobacteria bacterium]|nr:hypothetical protein [Fibrobacteria bacterium]